MLAAPQQNPRWSSVSPKESVFSVGTHDTEHVLMGKQEFEEVELEDGTRSATHPMGDYTSNPRFKFCFLGLWWVSPYHKAIIHFDLMKSPLPVSTFSCSRWTPSSSLQQYRSFWTNVSTTDHHDAPTYNWN